MKNTNKIETDIELIKQDVKFIRNTLEGNGHKGLISQVTSNTNWRYSLTGGLILLSSLVGWGLIK